MTSHLSGAPRRLLVAGLASAAMLAALLVASPTAHATALKAPSKVSTKTLLSQLKVGGEHTSGYKRSKFQLWTDADHDGCSTRAEVLLAEATKKPKRGSKCKLTGGKWTSKYDGKKFTNASKLDIDHMVPLNEAWQSGAYKWNSATRKAYANDLGYSRSLIAVSAHANRSKGDKDPQNWMPAKAKCSYVTSWVAVKWRWHLKINPSEKTYLSKKLKACGWPKITKPSRPKITNTSSGSGRVAPNGYNCPKSAPIKGNASSMIYHMPGGAYYDRTKPEDCFKTESAAHSAGYRRAKS